MQITPRGLVVTVALLASAPLLAANSGTSPAGTDASTQESRTTMAQDDCALPAAAPTDLSPDKLASLLPRPGSPPPDPAEVDRRLRKAAACARAAGLDAPREGSTSSETTSAATQASSSSGR